MEGQLGEVLLGLRRCRGTETLIVLDAPALGVAVGKRLLPGLVLGHGVEGDGGTALGHLDDGRDELHQEAGHLQEAREEVVEEVDQQALDVGPVVVLIRHNHQVPIPQGLDVGVGLAVLQAEDLLDGVDLDVVHDLFVRGVAYVEQLPAQGEHAVAVTPHHRQAADGQRLGGVSLSEDEGAVLGVFGAGVVGIVQLGDAGEARALGAIVLLQVLGLLEAGPRQDRLVDRAINHFLDDCVRDFTLGPERRGFEGERLFGLGVECRVLDKGVDKHHEMILDLESLHIGSLVLLVHH
mmetsp:Transcript_45800/g.76350  ORF Transcript_45800/g.76350 Transcript_45800/m.76350 type:complete len:294 (-) Transcript_45800:1235-2116(-)